MREELITNRALILIHLSSLSHAGNVYAKTAQGIAHFLELPAVTVYKTLVNMRKEELVVSFRARIEGKNMTHGQLEHPPHIYNLSAKGEIMLSELHDLINNRRKERA
jgi:hypothetical protein